jgi:hypothetical protein
MEEHLSGYQARDWEVVDYRMYRDERSGLWFRGPKPTLGAPGSYFVCIGAAQTLGCFCELPYPRLLEQRLPMTALNLGYGGAGPYFFLKHPELLEAINRARFAIVQVMSGRSENNQVYDSGGLEYLTRRSDGAKVSARQGYQDLLDLADRHTPLSPRFKRALRIFVGSREVKDVLQQTRENWIDSYVKLLSAIKVPKILLWYARRPPWLNYTKRAAWWWQRYDNVNALFGDYPQLVTPAMVRAIRPRAEAYVQCVTRRGWPQPLISRFNGEPVVADHGKDRPDLAKTTSVNAYYPSPQMHEDAARKLLSTCARLIARTSRPVEPLLASVQL